MSRSRELDWLRDDDVPYGTPRCRFCDRYLRHDGDRWVTWTDNDPLCDNGDDDLHPSHEPEDLALPGGALLAEHFGDEALDSEGGDQHEGLAAQTQHHQRRANGMGGGDECVDQRNSPPSRRVQSSHRDPIAERRAWTVSARAGQSMLARLFGSK